MANRVNLNEIHDSNATIKNKNTRPTNQNPSTQSMPPKTQKNESKKEKTPKRKNKSNFMRNNSFSSRFNGNSDEYSDSQPKDSKVKALLNNPVVKKTIIKMALIAIPILTLLLLIIFIISSIFSSNNGKNLAIGGYYASRCSEVTVIFTDKSNGYEVTGTNTYPLEEYIAGVVAGEVAFLGSLEVDKEFAIAARTYLLTHDDGNCTIESSDRKQVFRELTESPTDQLALEAANETAGKVLLSGNELYSVGYDAFCSIAKDENYYTIKQQNQKIPVDWVDSQRGIADSWKQGTCAGNHGRGLSQWGSFYLATEKNYTYEELLDFYLGDDNITISSTAGIINSDAKVTNGTQIDISIGSYLANHGSSIEELNNAIEASVAAAGKGTREGVVTAAVTLINYLYDNYKITIPYYWGGLYQNYGIPETMGNPTTPITSIYGTVYKHSGFDCSGFVSWAIKNGGYIMDRKTTSTFYSTFGSDSCLANDYYCTGQIGDLVNSDSHVQLIVSVDAESEQYIVAESTGRRGLVMSARYMHAGDSSTRILHMDSFYNNKNNVDPNY